MERLDILEQRVQDYLAQMDIVAERSEERISLFRYGSTVVMISLFEDGEDTFCRFASLMLRDFEPTLELLQKILRLNTEVLFGAFLLFEDNTLSFSATLLGNHLDFDEFDKTLRYVAQVSDDYDDDLQAVGGGQRASDVMGID